MSYATAFAIVVSGLAVLISAHTANPWVACIAACLFVFVLFPRWRTRLEKLIVKGIALIGKALTRRDHDRFDY